jgi:hypothetical protein
MAPVPHFIALIRKHLPLRIDSIAFDEWGFIIIGRDWRFIASSSWRVASAAGFHFGSASEPTQEDLESLIGRSIVSAAPLGTANLDPAFTLDNGLTFESFSATGDEPWQLRLPGEPIIIADGTGA